MSNQSTFIEAVEARTGLEYHSEETVATYVQRINARFSLNEEDADWFQSLVERMLFGPKTELDPSEREELDRIFRQASKSDERAGELDAADVSPRSRSIADLEAGSVEIPAGGTSTDERLERAEEPSSTPVSSSDPDRRVSLRPAGDVVVNSYDVVFVATIVAAAGYVVFTGLGQYPIAPWDEGFYANLARHMVQDGYWITPHMHYRIGLDTVGFAPWLRLPPLAVWLQAISMLVFGVNEFAVRLPSATATVLTAVLVYVIGRYLSSRRAGFLASLVYITTPFVYAGFNAGRQGGVDSLLTLFGSLFVFTAFLAADREDTRLLLPMGVFGALAVMTKGFGAGVFLVAVLPIVFLNEDVFLSRGMLLSTVVTAAIALPWPVYSYLTYGQAFVDQFLVRYIIERASGSRFVSNTNTLFDFMQYPYIKTLVFDPNFFGVWAYLFVVASGWVVYRAVLLTDSQPSSESRFLLWWAGAVLGLFVLIGSKSWYLMPIFVPGAVLVGMLLDSAAEGHSDSIGALGVGAVLVLMISPRFMLSLTEDVVTLAEGLGVVLSVLLFVWYAPLDQKLGRISSRLHTGTGHVIPVLVAVIVVLGLVGTPPMFGWGGQQRELADDLDDYASSDETVFIQTGAGAVFHSFSFYAQRPLASGNITELQESEFRYAVVADESLGSVEYSRILGNMTSASGQRVRLIEVSSA